jgi:hypothetical protein
MEIPPRQIRKSWIPTPLGTRKLFWQLRLPFPARRGGLPLPRFEQLGHPAGSSYITHWFRLDQSSTVDVKMV